MAYILVDPKVLESKGISYEKMPDGRAIAETNILKVLGSISNVEFVSTTKELNDMVEAQKKELEKEGGKKDSQSQEAEQKIPTEGEQEAATEVPPQESGEVQQQAENGEAVKNETTTEAAAQEENVEQKSKKE